MIIFFCKKNAYQFSRDTLVQNNYTTKYPNLLKNCIVQGSGYAHIHKGKYYETPAKEKNSKNGRAYNFGFSIKSWSHEIIPLKQVSKHLGEFLFETQICITRCNNVKWSRVSCK